MSRPRLWNAPTGPLDWFWISHLRRKGFAAIRSWATPPEVIDPERLTASTCGATGAAASTTAIRVFSPTWTRCTVPGNSRSRGSTVGSGVAPMAT